MPDKHGTEAENRYKVIYVEYDYVVSILFFSYHGRSRPGQSILSSHWVQTSAVVKLCGPGLTSDSMRSMTRTKSGIAPGVRSRTRRRRFVASVGTG